MHLPDFGGAKRMIAAVSSQFLMVELSPDATFLSANDLYCGFVGQDRATIKGKHHSCVVDAAYADSPQYREFLAKIARGEKFWEEIGIPGGNRTSVDRGAASGAQFTTGTDADKSSAWTPGSPPFAAKFGT